VHGEAAADETTLRLTTLEADLAKGRLIASATLPITFAPPSIGLRVAPLTATLQADAIDLSQFAASLPGTSTLAGTLSGRVVASGTVHDPAVDGSLALAGVRYSSELVRSPITNARAQLTFTRAQAQLTGVHAEVGGGTIDGGGSATFGDIRDVRRTLALNAQVTATNARLAVNPYLSRSDVNGTITATKIAGRRDVVIGGNVAFTQTRIPTTALIPASAPKSQATPAPLPIAFDLTVNAGNDVRVQGAGVDVGARGAITVGGTLAAPSLSGEIASTDGTLSFYRTFVLQQGTVAFDPSDGIIPSVDATATTTITNPNTDILLHVTGPATALNIDFTSDPSYSKEQILGLLVNAQAIGAVSGVQTAQNSGGSGINAANIAGGYLSSELTQNLLQPFGSQLGSSLGLSNLSLGYDYGSGFSTGASKSFGKNLSASFHQTFGIDARQVIGINYALRGETSVQLSLFDAGNQSANPLATGTFLGGTQDVFTPANYTLQALQPPPGVAGVVLTYQRKYWATRDH
jgi:translocation and assembly module TamB